ncbi:hypothetical protein UT300018_25970 [Clostridium faecium]
MSENKNSILKLLSKIPQNKREKLIVNICNIFQNREIIDTYEYYKSLIDMGFKYPPFRENLVMCEGSFVNSITVNPDGKIGPCQMCKEKGFYFGELLKDGELKITKTPEFYKFRDVNPFKNTECSECKNLPICLGGCPYGRYKNSEKCNYKNEFDNIEMDKLVKLDIYNDLVHDTKKCLRIS